MCAGLFPYPVSEDDDATFFEISIGDFSGAVKKSPLGDFLKANEAGEAKEAALCISPVFFSGRGR